nr:MAG TPA: hypothetical protein [Caudoviricetes sp.]
MVEMMYRQDVECSACCVFVVWYYITISQGI